MRHRIMKVFFWDKYCNADDPKTILLQNYANL